MVCTPGTDSHADKANYAAPNDRLNALDASIHLDWPAHDNLSLLSVTSIRKYQNFFAEDTDGSPLAVQQLLQVMKHEQWTQELRLNAALFDGYADVTVGWF